MRIGSSQFAFAIGQCVASPLDYETRIVDRNAAVPPPPPKVDYVLSRALLEMHAMHGAAGRSPLRREERRATVQPFAKVEPLRFAAVTDDLALLPDAKRDVTFSEALGSAALKRRSMVVNDFELAKNQGASMSDASVVFLPWVRQGLAARITTPDPLKTPLPAQAPLGVTLGVNNIDAASVGVRLFGPADVIGIDPRQVVRTEPPAGTDNYESNDLAAVEFDNPDLPWLFTPAAADGQGRVRPWIVLVVVRKQDGVRLRPPRTELLPVLEIGAPAVPSAGAAGSRRFVGLGARAARRARRRK